MTQKTQSPLKIEDLTAVGDPLRGESAAVSYTVIRALKASSYFSVLD